MKLRYPNIYPKLAYKRSYNEWSDINKIKEGLDRFIVEHGRLPTALEVDRYEYLPSSRWIQRKFGGLVKVRKILGYEISSFAVGENRRRIAKEGNIRSRVSEDDLEEILKPKFGEMFVHGQKRYGKRGYRLDSFVYSPSGNFGIDVFSTNSFHHLKIIINMKWKKYTDYPNDTTLFLLCATDQFSQEDIDRFCDSRLVKLPDNFKVVNLKTFLNLVRNMDRYEIPVPSPLK